MKIDIIVGARPNFIKIAGIISELNKVEFNNLFNYRLIHTGQHYDYSMSGVFFKDLNIPEPDIFLNCGGGTYSEQFGKIMIAYEHLLLSELIKPELCIVVGDVNSTVACAIVAKKMGLKVAHIEAGIRSYDFNMPEEINRILTDSITDYFFTTTSSASDNLLKNNVDKNNIFFVGNTMIDTLFANIDRIKKPENLNSFKIGNEEYLVLTIHRPSNVDNLETLRDLLNSILNFSKNYKIIFPIHPRTKLLFNQIDLNDERLIIVDPLPYLEFIYLLKHSKCIITDSGGITEESTVLNIPTITLRENTERPETVSIGSNVLVGNSKSMLEEALALILNGKFKNAKVPELWDGKTSKRIIDIIRNLL